MIRWIKNLIMKLRNQKKSKKTYTVNKFPKVDPSAEYYQEQTSFAYQIEHNKANTQYDYDGMEP
jgi:hypothetical protein